MGSKPFNIDFDDLLKVLIVALATAGIGGVSYVLEHIPEAGLGIWAPVATAILTAVVAFLRQWTKDNTK